jgi:hypothetical protein
VIGPNIYCRPTRFLKLTIFEKWPPNENVLTILDVVIQKAHEPPTQNFLEVAMSPPTHVPNVPKDAKGKNRWKIIKDDDGKDDVWTNKRPESRSQQTKSLREGVKTH